ncbi:hypothetical protein OIV83_001874 [Microbotryomycetes sp. JL201]|nr:hypothetical protein OIV83_001874 [Microbotryomycetes sp. JL201]
MSDGPRSYRSDADDGRMHGSPAANLPIELVLLILQEVQEPERTKLLVLEDRFPREHAFILDWKRRRKLVSLALVNRHWNVAAIEALNEIFVSENYYWDFKAVQDPRTSAMFSPSDFVFARDIATVQSQLKRHGPMCRILYLEQNLHRSMAAAQKSYTDSTGAKSREGVYD